MLENDDMEEKFFISCVKVHPSITLTLPLLLPLLLPLTLPRDGDVPNISMFYFIRIKRSRAWY